MIRRMVALKYIRNMYYILKMLEKYKHMDAKTVSTPADPNELCKDDKVSKPVDATVYQSMVGNLLYLSTATKHDISQAVGVVAKFSSSSTEAHLTAVNRIMRYLKGSVDLKLKYERSDDGQLIGYSDADYAGDPDDRHSTTGNVHVFLMSRGPISWLSKKQGIVTLLTAEAEYVALTMATQEAVWIRRLLSDLKVLQDHPTVLMENHQGAICTAMNPVSHARTKHINVRCHYIRKALGEETIELKYCPMNEMIADIFTKPLHKEGFEVLRTSMNLKPPPPAK